MKIAIATGKGSGARVIVLTYTAINALRRKQAVFEIGIRRFIHPSYETTPICCNIITISRFQFAIESAVGQVEIGGRWEIHVLAHIANNAATGTVASIIKKDSDTGAAVDDVTSI